MCGRGGRPVIIGHGRGMVLYVNVGAHTNYRGGNVVGQNWGADQLEEPQRFADCCMLELWGMRSYCGLLWESSWHIGTACIEETTH